MAHLIEHRQRKGERGFTLIEVMTAVTILAIMGTIAFTVVFGAVKRSRHIDRQVELRTEAVSIVNLIAEDIRGSFVKEGVAPSFQGRDIFHGEDPSDSISFLTTAVIPVSPEIPSGGVGEVEYTVLEGEGGAPTLWRREQIPARAPFDEGGETFEITDRIRSLNLQYNDGEEWFDQWDSDGAADHEAGKIPRQVRIELVIKDGDMEVTYRTAVAPVMAVGR